MVQVSNNQLAPSLPEKGRDLPKVMQQVCVRIKTAINVHQLLVCVIKSLCGFPPACQDILNTCLLLPDNVAFALVSGHGGFALVSGHGGTGRGLWLNVSPVVLRVGESV